MSVGEKDPCRPRFVPWQREWEALPHTKHDDTVPIHDRTSDRHVRS